jgi:peroxiredoxin
LRNAFSSSIPIAKRRLTMASRKREWGARRAQRLAAQTALERTQHRHHVHNTALSAVGIALAVAGLSVALGALRRSGAASDASAGPSPSQLMTGELAPSFRVRDVVSNRDVTLSALSGHKTLLFFSKGASCQACLVQAADLQSSSALRGAGIQLVSITTDPASVLAEVAAQYRLRTPLLADSDTRMSRAYGMLGRGGMEHPTQDGHAFVLIDGHGKVLWQHPYPEMYVAPKQLLHDMGAAR